LLIIVENPIIDFVCGNKKKKVKKLKTWSSSLTSRSFLRRTTLDCVEHHNTIRLC